MKKLSLKKLDLGVDDLLKREELKTVLGGGYDPWYPGGLFVGCTSGCVIEVPNCNNPDQYCPPGETALWCQ